jgi:hypothetical protein
MHAQLPPCMIFNSMDSTLMFVTPTQGELVFNVKMFVTASHKALVKERRKGRGDIVAVTLKALRQRVQALRYALAGGSVSIEVRSRQVHAASLAVSTLSCKDVPWTKDGDLDLHPCRERLWHLCGSNVESAPSSSMYLPGSPTCTDADTSILGFRSGPSAQKLRRTSCKQARVFDCVTTAALPYLHQTP